MSSVKTSFEPRYTKTIVIENETDKQFVEWMNNVEKYVYEKLELYLDDLPDEPFRYNFEKNQKWESMATHVVSDYMNSLEMFGMSL